MRIFFFIFFILIGRCLFGQDPHIVKKGETIYSIALVYEVSTEDLMNINGIKDPKDLKAGQKLKIPQKIGEPKADKTAASLPVYVVVKNDTLFSIAKRNGITVPELRKANELPDNYVLKTGDKLKLPTREETVQPPLAPEALVGEWPVRAKSLGKTQGKIAGGVIITSYAADIVRSLTRGTVQSAGPYLSYKNVIIVKTESGQLYIYGGCEHLSVRQGDKVGIGTELGRLSADQDPQLLFMVSKDGVYVDPAKASRN